jgi:hypothetical protein
MAITIEELKDSLGLSSVNEARNRFNAIRDLLEPFILRGEKNRLLLNSEGVGLLRKLVDLEKTGLSLAQAEKKLREELNSGAIKLAQPGDQTPREGAVERLIRHLEEQIQIKDRQLEEKDRQIERLQELLQNRLPGQRAPATEEENPIEFLRLTIEKQREEIERLRLLLEEERRPLWQRLLRRRRRLPQGVGP